MVVCTRVPKFHGDRRAYPRIYFRSAHDRTNGLSLSLSRCHCNNWQWHWRRSSHSNSLSRVDTRQRFEDSGRAKNSREQIMSRAGRHVLFEDSVIAARANSTWNFDKSRGDTAGRRSALPWTDPSGRKRIGQSTSPSREVSINLDPCSFPRVLGFVFFFFSYLVFTRRYFVILRLSQRIRSGLFSRKILIRSFFVRWFFLRFIFEINNCGDAICDGFIYVFHGKQALNL